MTLGWGAMFMNKMTVSQIPVSQARRLIINSVEELKSLHLTSIIWFFLFHIPLALLMFKVSFIATLHAFATLFIGIAWATVGRRIDRVAYIGAYIVGSEVLWRMTNAGVFWEYGKYATAAIFILAMLRRRQLKQPLLPILYFLLLLPSVLLTVENLPYEVTRRQLSFNLSGPFALMICAMFFSHLSLGREQVYRMFLLVIGPLFGIVSISLYTTLTASSIVFSEHSSNFITSGRFGPNQVSAVLGLGALLAFLLYFFSDRRRQEFKILMLFGIIIFATDSALTFSRGGLYVAAGGAILASMYLVKDARSRVTLIFLFLLFFFVAHFFLLPSLDTFTDGALSARFQSTELTGRDELLLDELDIWRENPIFGIGPGMAVSHWELFFGPAAAHTEFSRLLAEHGVFGIGALLLLLIMTFRNLKYAQSLVGKAFIASMIGWSFLFMLVNAMRIVAPAFIFGLTFVILLPLENENPLRMNSLFRSHTISL